MTTTTQFNELLSKLPKDTLAFILSDNIGIYSQLLAEQQGLTAETGVDIEDVVVYLIVGVINEAQLLPVINKLSGITPVKAEAITKDILDHVRGFNTPEIGNPVSTNKLQQEVTATHSQTPEQENAPKPPKPPKTPSNAFEARLQSTFSQVHSKDMDAEGALPPVPKKPTDS